MDKTAIGSLGEIMANTPLRLAIAAKIVFPDGSITASALRRENHRGRLEIERIAGKDYTTLADIERMRQLCRVESNRPAYTSDRREGVSKASSVHRQSGSFSTVAGTSPQDALRAKIELRRRRYAFLAPAGNRCPGQGQ